MGCLLRCNLFTDLGSYKLENQHSHIPLSPIHLPQSSFMVVRYTKRRDWEVDCFHRCCVTPLLSQAFSRLVGNAWISDPAPSGGSELPFRYRKGWHHRTSHLPGDRMLLAAGTHSSIRRVQELLYQEQWHLQLYWDTPPLRVPGLGDRALHSLDHLRNSNIMLQFSVQTETV
uniref:Cold acclimation protein n=1 Tax=Salvia miltiorrhiza TaxID=226208 RepID=C7FGL5_SALMI|nr:cold acclimation protein [Salvia miltiorrhiza]